MSEKRPPASIPEKLPQESTRESVLKLLKEKGKDDPDFHGLYERWLELGEESRDRGEATEGELTIDSIQLLLDIGLEDEAVASCQEIIDNFAVPAEDEVTGSGVVSDDGNRLYWFCISVLERDG